MNRQAELFKLCNESNKLKLENNGWSWKISKGNKYEIFNVPKYSLEDNRKIKLEHENYRKKIKKRAGNRTPSHSHIGFDNVINLVNYINKHHTHWGDIIKKSKK